MSTHPQPAPAPKAFPEQHHPERGHGFYPPAGQLAAIPPLYGSEDVATADKVIHLHYFVRDCDWWVCEYDPATGDAFGYARLRGDDTNAEWGYVNLPELEALHQQGNITRTAPNRLAATPPPHRRTRPALDTPHPHRRPTPRPACPALSRWPTAPVPRPAPRPGCRLLPLGRRPQVCLLV